MANIEQEAVAKIVKRITAAASNLIDVLSEYKNESNYDNFGRDINFPCDVIVDSSLRCIAQIMKYLVDQNEWKWVIENLLEVVVNGKNTIVAGYELSVRGKYSERVMSDISRNLDHILEHLRVLNNHFRVVG
jgi:hypothetical protein